MLFFFDVPPPPEFFSLSLHDALPICLIYAIEQLDARVGLAIGAHGIGPRALPQRNTQGDFETAHAFREDRKSTRLNSSHSQISYAVFCLKKKKSEDDGPQEYVVAIRR